VVGEDSLGEEDEDEDEDDEGVGSEEREEEGSQVGHALDWIGLDWNAR